MSLFGEKCARCERKTRHEVEGSATCETSEQEMKLLVEAKVLMAMASGFTVPFG